MSVNQTTISEKAEFNRQLAGDICKKWSVPKGGDVEPFFALFHDDATFTTMAKPELFPRLGGTKTKEEFKEWVYHESRLTDLVVNCEGVTADADRVAVEASSTMSVNGNEYNNLYHWLFEVKDGKISAARFYLDTLFAKKAIEWMSEIHPAREAI
ncbi:hypothetical protein VTL71DRAFT_6869 [Oculimacula yallundae]|uniref:SnoaL-like domain-containing protein n=1 Tax=Oculimacula yallundae TaxID=86028 RepID=A0ABR4BV21_9HELO